MIPVNWPQPHQIKILLKQKKLKASDKDFITSLLKHREKRLWLSDAQIKIFVKVLIGIIKKEELTEDIYRVVHLDQNPETKTRISDCYEIKAVVLMNQAVEEF